MIDCQHVTKEYISRRASSALRWHVEHIHVPKGERVLVTGPSGCGKTTLLHLIAGLHQSTGGTITVNDIRVDQLSVSEADRFRGQHLGLIFQSFQLLSPLTVLDNILLGARFGRKWAHAEAKEKADALLSAVGLHERRFHRPGELSLGEQQRVAIARALINEPPLLLADEPTASLDAANAAKVLDLLFTLCVEHGTTLVTVSHDMSISSRFDRMIDASSWMCAAPREVAHV